MSDSTTAQRRPRQPATNAQGEAARVQLLDAAEKLFADHGFFGVSVRDITELAQVRLAAVNYHFGSKEGLFAKVLERRASILNQGRRDLLHAALARRRAGPVDMADRIRDIVRAFYLPLLSYFDSGDEGWRSYGRLLSQVALNRRWTRTYVGPLYDEACGEFVDELMALSPAAGSRRALQCVQFMIALQLYIFSDNDREETMSLGRFSQQLTPMAAGMEDFCVAGVMRVLDLDRAE